MDLNAYRHTLDIRGAANKIPNHRSEKFIKKFKKVKYTKIEL